MIENLVALAKEKQATMNDFATRFMALETDEVMTCETNAGGEYRVFIYKGIEVLAAECGATIETRPRDSDIHPWEHYFTHDGVLFFEITSTENLI